MKRPILTLFVFLLTITFVNIAFAYQVSIYTDSIKLELHNTDDKPYFVENIRHPKKRGTPRNIILLIGDGMGVSHITAAMVANRGELNLSRMPYIGLTTTHAGDNFITDSGAGGTALATGTKSYNGAIGVDMDTIPVANIRELLSARGLSTGVVSTSSITHATPAAFVAHQPCREMHEEIALDFLYSGIDLFIGGGVKYFSNRTDGKDLIRELTDKGYTIDTNTTTTSPGIAGGIMLTGNRFAGLYAKDHLVPADSGRGDFLPEATKFATEYLSSNRKGFFLMVEGSQIDWGGHDNITGYIISEMLDFDKTVGEALRFAAKDRRTLVIVASDHETGGFAVHAGNYATGKVRGRFTSVDHTGAMVPVFAYGPGAKHFTGIYDNTDLPRKILKAMKIKTSLPIKK